MAKPRSRREADPDTGVEPEAEEALVIVEAFLAPPKRGPGRPPSAKVTTHLEAIHQEKGPLPDILFPPRPAFGDTEAYQPIYCELVIEFLGRGYSLSAFAAAAGISREMLLQWGMRQPEFVEAVKIAKLACQHWWEGMLLEVAQKGTNTSGRVTAIQFALKNLAKDDWTEVQKHEITGRNGAALGAPVYDTSRLTTEELVQLEHLSAKASPSDNSEGAG